MTVTEPRFTRAEVDVLLASRRKEREPRGSHGFTIAEATDPKNQYRFRAPDQPVFDFAQIALDRSRDAYRKKWPDANMSAALFRVELDE